MTQAEFLANVAAAIGRALDDEERSLLAVCLAPIGGVDKVEYVDLADAAERYARGKVGLWLYDKRTMVWIVGLQAGAHEQLAATLYGIYNDNPFGRSRESAAKYVQHHYGFYLSGAMNLRVPIKADDYQLSPEEEIFNSAKGGLAWRSVR